MGFVPDPDNRDARGLALGMHDSCQEGNELDWRGDVPVGRGQRSLAATDDPL